MVYSKERGYFSTGGWSLIDLTAHKFTLREGMRICRALIRVDRFGRDLNGASVPLRTYEVLKCANRAGSKLRRVCLFAKGRG